MDVLNQLQHRCASEWGLSQSGRVELERLFPAFYIDRCIYLAMFITSYTTGRKIHRWKT
ncbi:hypothetical protein BJX99DRAFT_240651 [Aspergillus californicus]